MIAFAPQPAQATVTEAWVQCYGSEAGSQDSAGQVVTDPAGNVIVAGIVAGTPQIIKYSGAGVPLWTNLYTGAARGVAVDASGNVFVAGYSVGSGGDWDYAMIAYSGAGVPLWTKSYGGRGAASDIANAMAVDASGNVFVTGYSYGTESMRITRRLPIRARACRCGPTATTDRETARTSLSQWRWTAAARCL